MAEAEKYAYADRSEYLGDPDFVKVPWQALTNKDYAKSLAQQIDVNKAKPSSQIRPGKLSPMKVTRPPTIRWWIKTVMPWR
jgi:gamma-glutamyltranspeptidase/glutathione hydrolase